MAANLLPNCQGVAVFPFFPFSFFFSQFWITSNEVTRADNTLNHLHHALSKAEQMLHLSFQIRFLFWISVRGLECVVQPFEIKSIHCISLISMISDALAKVCSFTDETKPERIRNILPTGTSPAHPPEIQILFKIYHTLIRDSKLRKDVYVPLNVIQGKVPQN